MIIQVYQQSFRTVSPVTEKKKTDSVSENILIVNGAAGYLQIFVYVSLESKLHEQSVCHPTEAGKSTDANAVT
jgi:hypothetical protein